jgi:cytochrome c5
LRYNSRGVFRGTKVSLLDRNKSVKQVARIIVGLAILVTGSVHAGKAEEMIAERLKKVGEVCLEGEDCASATATSGVAAAGGFDLEGTYNSTCGSCHAVGVAGAPKLGDVAAWEPRIAQGMDVLYDHGINGLGVAMPARGLCMTCSDDDIKALVDYMVDSVK